MNPNTIKRYKRISNWLLVLAVILFIAGIAILVGPVIIQENEMNTAAQEYEQLVEDNLTDSDLDSIVPTAEFLTDSDISVSTFQIAPGPDSDAVVAPVIPLDEKPALDDSITQAPSNRDDNVKPLPEAPVSGAQSSSTDSAIDLAALKKQNKDFVAWLNIPGTKVDYPVVLSDNTDYYLTHTFSGAKSSLGTLFSLGKTDYANGKAIAIYGHHITGSGEKMFKPLLSYKEQSFYTEHQYIHLTTMSGERTYKIFAVVNLTSSEWDPSTATFASNDEFMTYVNRACEQALYSTGVSVSPSDRILTLITCDRSYAGSEGRLVVMAVQQ